MRRKDVVVRIDMYKSLDVFVISSVNGSLYLCASVGGLLSAKEVYWQMVTHLGDKL